MEGVKKKIDKDGNLWIEIDQYRSSDYVFQNITTYGEDITLLSVSSNTRVHALCIVIYNKESGAVTVTIKDGDSQAYPTISVDAGSTVRLTYSQLQGLNFTDSIVVNISGTASSGTEIFIGYLVENNTTDASP